MNHDYASEFLTWRSLLPIPIPHSPFLIRSLIFNTSLYVGETPIKKPPYPFPSQLLVPGQQILSV
jgi:hypothetical protein